MFQETQQFSKMSRKLLVMQELLAFLVFIVIAAFPFFLITNLFWWIFVMSVCLVCYLFIALIYFPIRFHHTAYCITADKIYYQTGFFMVKNQVMARRRVVYITLYKNPFTPIFHFATVVVRATGGSIRLFGLPLEEAERVIHQFSPLNEL